MLSEVFAAESQDAACECVDTGPSRAGVAGVVEAAGFTPLEFDALQATLTGQAVTDVLESPEGGLVLARGDTGPWVTRLRPVLGFELAALDRSRFAGVADRWAGHDEMRGHDPDELAAMLSPLVDLARVARDIEADLYLWNRL